MSIRLKILIALLCTGVIPALSFWWFTETVVHRGRMEAIQSKLQVFADLKSQRIEDSFEHATEKVALISSRTQMRNLLTSHLIEPDTRKIDRIEKILTDASRSVPSFEKVFIASTNRTIIASSTKGDRGKKAEPNKAFELATLGKYGYSYILKSTPEKSPAEEIQEILCGPLFHGEALIGIVVVYANVSTVQNSIDDAAGFEGEGRTRLVRINNHRIERGLIPLEPKDQSIGLMTKTREELTDISLLRKNSIFYDSNSETQYLVAISPVSQTDLAIVTDIKKDTALSSATQIITFGRSVGILSLLSIGVVSFFFARTLSRPLRGLAQTAAKISAGDLDARAVTTTKDEVGVLARRFNRMAEKLVNANRNLEKKVEERTAQLETTQHLLIQSEKLESMGRMAAGIAHEVKNPLFVIQSGLDYFGLTLKDANQTTHTTLELMEGAVERANSIVLGMLELSRSEEFTPKAEDLNELVRKSVILIDHGLTERSIYLTQDLESDLPQVRIDFHKMEQVIINLLDNAIHASPKGGSITIKTYLKQLAPVERNEGLRHFDRLREDDTVALIEITNTGPQIDDENMRKLFDPFFTTKPSNEGTGLGLAVCKTIIDLHNGSIHVENVEIPEGVRVSIMLKVDA